MTRTRTQSPTPTRTRLARNGTRQPQSLNASPEAIANSDIASVPRMRPMGTPTCGQLAIRPRLRWSPHSIDNSTEPLHSPPTAMPCRMRRMTSRTGAATPMVAVPGSRPISALDTPIMTRVMIRVALRALRPILSPQWPKRAAPIGLATKPTA